MSEHLHFSALRARWTTASFSLSPDENDASFFLASIRIVAAQAVLFGHAISYFGQYSFLSFPSAPSMQNIAVVVFFLLSGFLISHTLHKNASRREYSYAVYAVDRVARIYSGYIPALLLVAACDFVVMNVSTNYIHGQAFDLVTFVGNVLMLQDAPGFRGGLGFVITSFGSARPLWTLSIEMWIYLFYGAVFMLLGRGRWPATMVLLSVLSVVPVYNLLGGRGNGLFFVWLLGALSERTIAVGVLRRIPSIVLVQGAALLAAGYWLSLLAHGKNVYVLMTYPLAAAEFVALMELSTRSSFAARRPNLQRISAFFADYSLTLYLVHYTIVSSFVLLYDGDKQIGLWLALLTSEGVAIVLAQVTEKKHRHVARYIKRAIGVGSQAA